MTISLVRGHNAISIVIHDDDDDGERQRGKEREMMEMEMAREKRMLFTAAFALAAERQL